MKELNTNIIPKEKSPRIPNVLPVVNLRLDTRCTVKELINTISEAIIKKKLLFMPFPQFLRLNAYNY